MPAELPGQAPRSSCSCRSRGKRKDRDWEAQASSPAGHGGPPPRCPVGEEKGQRGHLKDWTFIPNRQLSRENMVSLQDWNKLSFYHHSAGGC